jgi:hypothetical protein
MANLPGVRVALTLPLNIRERLEQLADAEHRTMSQQVCFWVERASTEATAEDTEPGASSNV